jgi:hypothetical protein
MPPTYMKPFIFFMKKSLNFYHISYCKTKLANMASFVFFCGSASHLI